MMTHAYLLSAFFTVLIAGPGCHGAERHDTFSVTGSLITGRMRHTATRLQDGRVLIVGGYNPAIGYLNSAEIYDPKTGIFSQTGSMSQPRQYHTATLLPNGRVLVAGGFGSTWYDSTEIYDPTSGTFLSGPPMAMSRACHNALLLPNGNVLVAGGDGNGQSTLSSAEIYGFRSNMFRPIEAMSTPRSHFRIFISRGFVILPGGYDGHRDSSVVDAFSIKRSRFAKVQNLLTSRYEFGAAFLPKHDMLIVGGYHAGMILSSAEVYRSKSRAFLATNSMHFAREYPITMTLRSGNVLVAGGSDQRKLALKSAEIFDPASMSFHDIAPMNFARGEGSTATMLLDGRLLIVGGAVDDGRAALDSAEIYGPAELTGAPLSSATQSGDLSNAATSGSAMSKADDRDIGAPLP